MQRRLWACAVMTVPLLLIASAAKYAAAEMTNPIGLHLCCFTIDVDLFAVALVLFCAGAIIASAWAKQSEKTSR